MQAHAHTQNISDVIYNLHHILFNTIILIFIKPMTKFFVKLLIEDKIIICVLGNLLIRSQEKNSNLNRDSNLGPPYL